MTITKYNQRGQSEHHHELELRDNKYKQFICDGCKEPGFGSRYRCEECDYNLHKECKSPKSTIAHDFFKCSKFEFFHEPQPTKCGKGRCKTRVCDACGKDINGFSYHCTENGYDLHPCCSNLEEKLKIGDTVFELRKKVLSECQWCENKKLSGTEPNIQGWSYVSQCNKYHFHVYCVTQMVLEAWKKGASTDESNSIRALEKIDLRLVRKSDRDSGGRGSGFWTTVKLFLKAIISVLVGDPTMLFASFLVELISK